MTADAPGRVGRRSGATGAFGQHTAARRGPRDFGPFDAEDLDPAAVAAPGTVDFGSVRVPVPEGGTVTVEPTANGRLQAVHVSMPGGRLSVSALAAPKSSELWPELVAEIDTSLRDGGARVRSFQGEWGRELHARTGAANSVFIGVDGARWMLYGVATGPATYAVELEAALRTMLKGAVVDRGRSPYPVRTVLPLVVPEDLAADGIVEDPLAAVPGPPAPAPRIAPTSPRATPETRRPVPPRIDRPAPVSADATQALPVSPRVAAGRRPVGPPRTQQPPAQPQPPTPQPAPTPLWATSPQPVSASDLGRDPADDLSVDRPLNDVVTPTEWWPVIPPAAGADRRAVPTAGSAEVEAPPTERWAAVPVAGQPVQVDDGVPTEWWPAVPGPAVRTPDEDIPAEAIPAQDTHRTEEPADGETFYAELRSGRPTYVDPLVSELVPFESLDAEPLDSEPLFAGLIEARRRPVPEVRNEPARSSGRRRAPEEPARSGGRRRAPDAPPRPASGGGRRRAPEPPDDRPTEVRLADDTLDLAALVRGRPGRRRARYEAGTPDEPVSRPGGRRRAPEPPGEVTAPLPAVTEPSAGRHGRGAGDPDRAGPHDVDGSGSGPAPALLATTPARNPGRHHRPV